MCKKDLDYDGMMNLLRYLVKSAQRDYRQAYLHWKVLHRLDPDDETTKSAECTLEHAKDFFYSDMWSMLCDLWGKKYIDYLNKMIDSGHYGSFFEQLTEEEE